MRIAILTFACDFLPLSEPQNKLYPFFDHLNDDVVMFGMHFAPCKVVTELEAEHCSPSGRISREMF